MATKKTQQSYQNQYSYGYKMLKGITSDQIATLVNLHPLLQKYYSYNQAVTQQRIIDTLMREPSQSDCPGFIYGFRNKEDYQSDPMPCKYDIKLGRTKREVPQQRIYEWERDDHHEYVEIFTVRSQHNNKLESLVHLFFAYARKTKYIDGKRRIEWFTFNQKTLTAATVNLIDSIMEKVHQMAQQNNIQKVTLNFSLQNWLTSVQNQIAQVIQMKKRLLLFGFKNNGKTILKKMLHSVQLTCDKKTKNFCQIVSSENPDQTTILQIQFGNEKEEQTRQLLSLMSEAFLFWSNVYSTRHLTSCLIVRQADLMSSMMIGLRQTIANYKKHMYSSAFPQNFIIVVTHCDPDFNEKDVQQILQNNKQLLSLNENDKFIKEAKYFCINKPTSTGKFKYNIEPLKGLIQSNQNYLSFDYKCSLLKTICQQVIHYSYQDVGQIYQKAAKKRFASIQDELQGDEDDKIIDFKLKLLLRLKQVVKNLKQQQTQSEIFRFMKYLNIDLKLSEQKCIYSQFYVFCECMAKQSLHTTIVFTDIQEELNKQHAWIRDKCNLCIDQAKQKLIKLLKQFYQGIKDQSTFDKVFTILSNICEQVSFENAIQKIVELNSFPNVGNLNQIIEFFFRMKQFQSQGINIVNLKARINEAIFLGTKNRKAIQAANKPEEQKPEVFQVKSIPNKSKKQSKKSSKSTKQPIKQQTNLDYFIKAKQKKNEAKKQVIVIDSDEDQQIRGEMIDFHSPNLNQLMINYSKSKQAQQKQFTFNSFQGQFIVNIDQVNMVSETIIFAKSVKIVQKINFNFLSDKKIKLIIVAQSFQGVQKIKINNVNNSSGCLLHLKNREKKQFVPLDEYHIKNKQKLAKLCPQKMIEWYCLKVK